jgi:hypothetical protein
MSYKTGGATAIIVMKTKKLNKKILNLLRASPMFVGMRFLATSVIITVMLSAPVRAIDIYILAGQSNMQGSAPITGCPSPSNPSMLLSFNVNTAQWVQAKDPLSNYAGSGMGPGMSFASTMATLTGEPVGVVMCAKGGTHLAEWMPDYMTHSLYGAMISNARKAAAAGGNIVGLVWYQGESDADNVPDVIAYTQRMHALFTNVRIDLGIPELPIVFVKLGPNPHEAGYEYWYDIQMRQQYIADAKPPGIAMADASDLQAGTQSPHHLSQASMIILGARIAQKMYDLSFQ